LWLYDKKMMPTPRCAVDSSETGEKSSEQGQDASCAAWRREDNKRYQTDHPEETAAEDSDIA
jgi:hypothetical protein